MTKTRHSKATQGLRKGSILATIALTCLLAATHQKLVIANWERLIDVSKQTPIYENTVQLENDGTSDFEQFEVAIPKNQISKISHILAEDSYGNKLKTVVSDNSVSIPVKGVNKDFVFVNIIFAEKLTAKRELEVTYKVVYYGEYTFLPEAIDLFEDQKVLFWASLIPTTPYVVRELDVRIRRARSGKGDSVLTEKNVDPLSYREKKYHFQMNSQFLQMRSSSRFIEISHWGNIKFNEHYDMQNRGAKFIGEFSTLDFNDRNTHTGKNAFRRSTIHLPLNTWGFSYRDELGNISTSVAKRNSNKGRAEVVLKPRYALLGGWNSTWEIGYNVYAEDLLMQNPAGTEFLFEYEIDQTIKEGISDDYLIKIAIPEGATILDVDVAGYHNAQIETSERTFGYLDFIGRPTAMIRIKNHVPGFNEGKVRVRYAFSKTNMMIEPLYLVAGLFGIFLFSIVVNRLNLDFKEEK